MNALALSGVAVAITGGARGIGRATAKAFIAEGARVYIGDLDADLAETTADELGCQGVGLDVRSRASFTEFLAGVDGPLQVLVNNAGIMPAGRFVDELDAVTDSIVDVNLNGVLRGTKLALPGMLENGSGHIVNVASYLGRVPAAGLATYCATKHAVVGFSESLRDELDGTGVTVTVVLPSAVRTDLVSGVKLGGVLPTVDPKEIADAVVSSCRSRPAIVAVPGWMRSYETAAALVPDRLLGAVRGRLTRQRVLQALDTDARAAYDARIRRDAGASDS
ncbi:putative short chain dehydrogenase/reductase [Mycolicibacterium cyprinidarum]|uniref:Short chain dehydrogenase/reductase n=1 Tax=Mycolicibacterium cyprinidarum TaxID=2860311 RepID=A0ABQ4V5G5_9MYCO|nr:putative short chain dehydrogenase/reductase [Mycolicibacterium sp. NGTWS1803]GJF10461.1 putative short chain dehydrogenase/reductase [Mycolicibacterium sp. NGTWSNA01]GJF15264.1 putative short chain dehydrogenase/reductase [Mycolicibacterium sp. NGTWS0302]